MKNKTPFSFRNFNDRIYLIIGGAIIGALLLTFISFLGLCSEQCKEGHHYLLFGYPFESIGFLVFGSLALLHVLQRSVENLSKIEFLLFSSALGAEGMFILAQKYMIGSWCPVCLAIAGCVLIGTCGFIVLDLKKSEKENNMKLYKSFIKNILAMTIGFFVAFMGLSKHDAMQAAEQNVQERLAFGDKDSKMEIYLFTDWKCPACRKLEPSIEEIAAAIIPQARLIFIDEVVHPETLNFIPFNLSFMIHNKDNYFKLRSMLTDIAKKTKEPTEAEVAAEAAKLGSVYIEPHYSDIALAVEYYKKLGEKFEIKSTPTLIIVNRETKKGKRLVGDSEISKENVLKNMELLAQ